jgi:hypothetical protein
VGVATGLWRLLRLRKIGNKLVDTHVRFWYRLSSQALPVLLCVQVVSYILDLNAFAFEDSKDDRPVSPIVYNGLALL